MHRKNRNTLLVVWSAVILAATLFPGNRFPDLEQLKNIDGFDLLVHGVLFLIWSILFLRAFFNVHQLKRWNWRPLLITAFAGMVFGAFTEFLQFLVPVYRLASWFDFIADTAGTILGVAFWIFILPSEQQEKSILQGK